MILFKCDVCGCDCPEKVVSCQLAFGVKNISTNKIGQKATMYAMALRNMIMFKMKIKASIETGL